MTIVVHLDSRLNYYINEYSCINNNTLRKPYKEPIIFNDMTKKIKSIIRLPVIDNTTYLKRIKKKNIRSIT